MMQGMVLADALPNTSQSTTVAAGCRGQITNIWSLARYLLCSTKEEGLVTSLSNKKRPVQLKVRLLLPLIFWIYQCIFGTFQSHVSNVSDKINVEKGSL